MCDDPEDDLTTLAPIAPGPQGGTEPALDHRVDRLRLPPLAVFRLEAAELLPHPATPPPDRRLLRRPSPLRRDDRADAIRLPDVLMNPLAIVVGVSQQRPDPRATGGVLDRRLELLQVRAGTAAGDGGQHHVTLTVGDEDDLRVLGVSRFLGTTTGL